MLSYNERSPTRVGRCTARVPYINPVKRYTLNAQLMYLDLNFGYLTDVYPRLNVLYTMNKK